MKYRVEQTSKFRKELKKVLKRGKDKTKLLKVVRLLADGKQLPEQYKDHALTGDYAGFRDCHIEPDWLLIYAIDQGALVLSLTRTGSHSDLF